MKIYLMALVAALLAVSTTVWAAAGEPKYSLEQLDAAAQILMWTSDHGAGPCKGMTAKEAKKLILPLHAKIDQEIASSQPELAPKDCEQGCHCGVYATALERVPGKDSQVEALNKKAAGQGQAALKKCVFRAGPGFCKSALLKTLRSEASNY